MNLNQFELLIEVTAIIWVNFNTIFNLNLKVVSGKIKQVFEKEENINLRVYW